MILLFTLVMVTARVLLLKIRIMLVVMLVIVSMKSVRISLFVIHSIASSVGG